MLHRSDIFESNFPDIRMFPLAGCQAMTVGEEVSTRVWHRTQVCVSWKARLCRAGAGLRLIPEIEGLDNFRQLLITGGVLSLPPRLRGFLLGRERETHTLIVSALFPKLLWEPEGNADFRLNHPLEDR